jgi:Uma2 family endonuclease
MSVQTSLITAEELESMVQPDARTELVRGEIVKMSPAGFEHGAIALAIAAFLRAFVRQHKLGTVCAAETGFILTRDPDTVRAPDAAFVAAERVARQQRKEGFFEGPPDLAVEVVSPGDTDEEVEARILDYLGAGTQLVWIVRPKTRTITVYRSLKNVRVLTTQDSLEGDDVLPGFSIPVAEVFE